MQTACVESMDLRSTLPAPEFVSLPVPTNSVIVDSSNSTISSSSVVTMHVGKATIDIPESTSIEFIQKLIGALVYVE